MFHVELRRFPHTTHAHNLSADELEQTVLAPWRAGRPFRFGEREWVPTQARLTVLEGPQLAPGELSLGRGWSIAQRRSREVTALVLGRGAPATGGRLGSRAADALARDGGGAGQPIGDFARELLALCAQSAQPPRAAWRLASDWHPGHPASARLALAEQTLIALVRAGLLAPRRESRAGPEPIAVSPAELEALLRAWETWAQEGSARLLLELTDAGRGALANAAEPRA